MKVVSRDLATLIGHNGRTSWGISSAIRTIDLVLAFVSGEGAHLWDLEGKRYIDFHAGFAPNFPGHNFAQINQAAIVALKSGDSLFGAGMSVLESNLGELVCHVIPIVEKVTLLNTCS